MEIGENPCNNKKFEKVVKNINNHFLGYMKNKPLEIKKLRVLEIYRYLYRFSFVRSQNFVDNSIFIMFIHQYIKDSKMKRVHTRSILRKNKEASYRALENLLNNSCHSNKNSVALDHTIGNDLYQIEENNNINLEKLFNDNDMEGS